MVQQRGRRTPKLTAAMGEYLERMTSSYCPECGRRSVLVDGIQSMRMPEKGSVVRFRCPECGEFSAEWDDQWKVAGTDIPYIMNAENNSATLLHRFDASQYADETEAASVRVRLMCETAVNYHYVGDRKRSEDLVREAFALTIESLGKGLKDISSSFFGCINLFFTMAANGRMDIDETEAAVADILEVCGSYDRMLLVGILSMCAESLDVVGGTPGDDFFELYDRLTDSEPEPIPGASPFSASTFWEGLALVAVTLGRSDDVQRFGRKVADTWRRICEDSVPAEEDLDRLMMFVLTLSDNVDDDSFDGVMDSIQEIAGFCSSVSPYMSDSLLMIRYEHCLENGLHPYDRTDDLTMLIERYAEPRNTFEASIAVKARVHRALESEDMEDAFTDFGEALDISVSSRLQDTEYRDLVMDMAVRYYDLADEDKKVQRSMVMKLKRMGITKDMLKSWKKHS